MKIFNSVVNMVFYSCVVFLLCLRIGSYLKLIELEYNDCFCVVENNLTIEKNTNYINCLNNYGYVYI